MTNVESMTNVEARTNPIGRSPILQSSPRNRPYQPVEKGRAKLPLSRKHREKRLGRSLALPKIKFFNGLLLQVTSLIRIFVIRISSFFCHSDFDIMAQMPDNSWIIDKWIIISLRIIRLSHIF